MGQFSACIAVLKKILSDDHFGRDCLAWDDFPRQALFEIGGIDVLGNVKVLVVTTCRFK
jgi:hypothetical protein